VVIVEPWLKSWGAIISNIPDWCMQLIRQPRFRPDQITFPQPRRPRSHPEPTHVLVTPRTEWFIVYSHAIATEPPEIGAEAGLPLEIQSILLKGCKSSCPMGIRIHPCETCQLSSGSRILFRRGHKLFEQAYN
jgi:hypothetical protein